MACKTGKFTVFFSSSKRGHPLVLAVLVQLGPEDEGSKIHRNVDNSLQGDHWHTK